MESRANAGAENAATGRAAVAALRAAKHVEKRKKKDEKQMRTCPK